jgi:hypothetical protein
MGHALMENRSGLIVAATVTKATGTAERVAAEEMIVRHSPGARRLTLGADKGYNHFQCRCLGGSSVASHFFPTS